MEFEVCFYTSLNWCLDLILRFYQINVSPSEKILSYGQGDFCLQN